MGPVAQPVGRVTLVFTDVEGSTRLLRELGEEAYRRALGDHRSCVREAFGRHQGYEVGCEGDSFFYAFDSPEEAVRAVSEAVAGLEGGPVRVRVGVHSGEPGVDPPNYVGLDVHKAARVMAAGHGGQVVLSHATRELIGDRVAVRYLGEYRLKDLPLAERLYQLGLGEFPPLRTLYHSNLPVPATAFLGRQHELEQVVRLLLRDDVHLLTLTGPGGTGKTRLALHATASVSEQFPDGVWWVPLASLRDPALVLTEVARVLEIDQPGREPAELLAEVLAGKRLLLLLDNAEHLLPDAAVAVAQLRDLVGPKLIVTSRERLQLAGEHVYQVPSLTEADGVALFTACARAVGGVFEAGPAVHELCARLDHLPLALELAAARTIVLSTDQILQRLSQRLDLLQAGRDANLRQQTLRSTIAWSHELLTYDEQRLFARLAVFAGGCTPEAAEQICDADLDLLAALVDKSLLRRTGERYWMLETIREYAAERLDQSEDTQEFRRRHAEFYDRFAAEAEQGMRGRSVGPWLDQVEQELPNLRVAIELSLEGGEPAAAVRISTALERFWQSRDGIEGHLWLERALGSGGGTDAERGKASVQAASLAFLSGDTASAVRLYGEAIELASRAGDDATQTRALGLLGWVLAEQGESPRGSNDDAPLPGARPQPD